MGKYNCCVAFQPRLQFNCAPAGDRRDCNYYEADDESSCGACKHWYDNACECREAKLAAGKKYVESLVGAL